MMHHPFQIARWALLASFAVMVFVVAFPNPSPSQAWTLAEKNRYEQRFPVLQEQAEPTKPTETQLANRPNRIGQPTEVTTFESSPEPLRTAHLGDRSEHVGDLPSGVRIQEPVFFFEDEEPTSGQLAPDPAHLEPPTDVIRH